VPDGVCNPVRNVYCVVPDGVFLCRTGFATPFATFIVLCRTGFFCAGRGLQPRSQRLLCCAGRGLQPRSQRFRSSSLRDYARFNVTDGVANPVRQRDLSPTSFVPDGEVLYETPVRNVYCVVLDGVCNPVRNVSVNEGCCAGRGLQPRPQRFRSSSLRDLCRTGFATPSATFQ
jgi:hypothetical protein